MEPITFYYDLLSQPCRTLHIFLSVNKIPFISKELQLTLGEHRTEEFRNINPMRKVPVITCGNLNLAESVAIIRFLTREGYLVADHWYPKDSKASAKVDEYLEFQHIGLRAPCELYFLAKCFDPIFKKINHDPDYLDFLKSRMIQACNQFEEVWLKNKPFICGECITVADLFAATELEQLKLTGYDPRRGRPNLYAWLAKVRKETNPHYDIAHATLNTLAITLKEENSNIRAKN